MDGTQEAAEGNVATTWGQVAARYGVSRDTVRRDWRNSGMPALPCPWAAIDAWRETLKKPAAGSPGEDPLLTDALVLQARRAKILAEAKFKEGQATVSQHRARQLASDLVSMATVEKFLVTFFTETRVQLQRLPEEVAAAYPDAWREQLRDDLRARVDLVLGAIHGHVLSVTDLREANG